MAAVIMVSWLTPTGRVNLKQALCVVLILSISILSGCAPKVRLTESGISPSSIEVGAKDKVVIANETGGTMRVYQFQGPSHALPDSTHSIEEFITATAGYSYVTLEQNFGNGYGPGETSFYGESLGSGVIFLTVGSHAYKLNVRMK